MRDTNNPMGLIKEEMNGRAQRRRSLQLRRLFERCSLVGTKQSAKLKRLLRAY